MGHIRYSNHCEVCGTEGCTPEKHVKKNCPKDADRYVHYAAMLGLNVTGMSLCGALDKTKTFKCTRPKGHAGKHHTHSPNGNCYATW